MAAKMLQITAQNGAGGYGNSPVALRRLHQRDERNNGNSPPTHGIKNTPLLLSSETC